MSISELLKSIKDKIKGIKDGILAAYDVIAERGGETEVKTMENLPNAIRAIPKGLYDQLEDVGWTKEQIEYLKEEANLDATKLSITSTSLTQEEKDKVIFAKGLDKPTTLLQYLYGYHNVEYIPPIDCSNLVMAEHSSCFRSIKKGRRLVDIYLYNLNTDYVGQWQRNYAFKAMCYESKMVRSVTMLGDLSFNLTGHPFYECTNLTSLTLGNCSKMEIFTMFDRGAANLTDFSVEKLPNVDLLNAFSPVSKLTHDSLLNILNALPETTEAYTCTLGSTNLAKLTDEEKAIAIDKGWTLN